MMTIFCLHKYGNLSLIFQQIEFTCETMEYVSITLLRTIETRWRTEGRRQRNIKEESNKQKKKVLIKFVSVKLSNHSKEEEKWEMKRLARNNHNASNTQTHTT